MQGEMGLYCIGVLVFVPVVLATWLG